MLLINVDPDYVSTNASPGEPHTDLGVGQPLAVCAMASLGDECCEKVLPI